MVKADYPTREMAQACVGRIKKFISDGGFPHLWQGHTHTAPPEGAVPVYLDEFDLAEKHRRGGHLAPCPCCWPEHGKYGRNGKIAWFPDEHVIRLLGPDCFRALNPEAHQNAVENMRADQDLRGASQFLIANMAKLPAVVQAAETAAQLAAAIDAFHKDLHEKLGLFGIEAELWKHTRQGELRHSVQTRVMRRRADGSTDTVDGEDNRLHARLSGHRMLDPSLARKAPALRALSKQLAEIADRNVDEISDTDRVEFAAQLSRLIVRVREKSDEVAELRKFAERVTINTLRRWGELPGCPVASDMDPTRGRYRFRPQ